jgi:DNA polymerase III delta subunit
MFNAFAVIDAILAGDTGTAIERLRNMFAADRSAEFTVVGAFAYHFRRMFSAKALLERGMGQRDVMSQLRIWGNVDGFFRQLRQMSLERIGGVICELARIDYASKTGGTTGKVAIERLVVTLGV